MEAARAAAPPATATTPRSGCPPVPGSTGATARWTAPWPGSWNGPWTLDDEAAVAAWDNLLVASGRNGTWIPAVGGSDAHSEPQVIGLSQNVVHADDLDRRSILAAVKAGRLWTGESAAVNLTFTASAPGRHGAIQRAGIGERFEVDDDVPVAVTLAVDGAPGTGVRLVTDQGQRTAAVLPASGAGTVTWQTTPQNSRYVRAELRRPVPTGTTADTGRLTPVSGPAIRRRLPETVGQRRSAVGHGARHQDQVHGAAADRLLRSVTSTSPSWAGPAPIG